MSHFLLCILKHDVHAPTCFLNANYDRHRVHHLAHTQGH